MTHRVGPGAAPNRRPPPSVMAFATEVSYDVDEACEGRLAACYVHGSSVLRGFQPGRSDVDTLVILEDAVTSDQVQAVGRALARERTCPGIGLEAPAVSRSAALTPGAPWPFLVHVTTAPNGPQDGLG